MQGVALPHSEKCVDRAVEKKPFGTPLAETESETIEPYYDWESEFIREEFSAGVKRALLGLPADYRMAVLLADVEEFTYQEIARIMECPIGTVMSEGVV